MKTKFLKFVFLLFASTASAAVFAHGDDPKAKEKGEKLGRVLFKTSCTPEAQKQFERALAMLHSFYFPETVKAFTAVPETDPSCAIAYWGVAVQHPAEPAGRAVGRRDPEARARRGREGRGDRRQDRARA